MAKSQDPAAEGPRYVIQHQSVGAYEQGQVVTVEQLGGEANLPRLLELEAVAEHDGETDPAAPTPTDAPPAPAGV